ncbi:hypothetical protein MD484_g6513, partial [Candolleomyces efflorescens]
MLIIVPDPGLVVLPLPHVLTHVSQLSMDARTRLILSALHVSQNEGYSKAAAVTFLVCDTFSTFRDEVRYIWGSKWSFTKILYLIFRPLALTFGNRAMLVVGRIPNPSPELQSVPANFERSWERDRKVLAILVFFTAFDVGVRPLSLSLGLTLSINVMYLPSRHNDDSNNKIYKIRQSFKEQFGSLRAGLFKREGTITSPLMMAFARDGAFAFLALVAILGVSFFLATYRGGFYYGPVWPWSYAVFSGVD